MYKGSRVGKKFVMRNVSSTQAYSPERVFMTIVSWHNVSFWRGIITNFKLV